MTMISRFFDGVFGRGEHAITIPAMDGALRPNTALDAAQVVAQAPGCDNLSQLVDVVVYSQGRTLMVLGDTHPHTEFSADITLITALPGGGAVVGCEDGALYRLPDAFPSGSTFNRIATLNCPTAAVALDDETLIVTCGSNVNAPDAWSRDLLEKRRTGSVVRLDLQSGETVTLASGLAWPAGVAATKNGSLLVSEAWAARLIEIDMTGRAPRDVLGNLPGYPGHISHGESGLWVAIFAPRSQLLEFVLRERKFRDVMLAEIEPAHWIAPTLRSGAAFHEPLQAGGVRQLGQLKPWAPTRSFGLVLHLDEDLNPDASYHSRADGKRHGVTSILEADGQVLFAAKGDGIIGQFQVEVKT